MSFDSLLASSVISMGSASSTSSVWSFRKSSWSSSTSSHVESDIQRPFVDMIKDHSVYGLMIRSPTLYEVKLVHGARHLHWFLLIKMKDSELPYITFEITTSNLTNLIQTTRTVTLTADGLWSDLLSNTSPTDIGTYNGSLHKLCLLADEVVEEMGTYHLLDNNCQDFCNKLLNKIGKGEHPTTIRHQDATNYEFDFFNVVLHKIYDAAMSKARGVFADAAAAIVSLVVGAPQQSNSQPCQERDLKATYTILIPLAHKWKEIGEKLFSGDELNRIECEYHNIPEHCLREMLRVYLTQVNPPPSWEVLAEAVKEYSQPLAVKILDRAPYKRMSQLTIN